MEIFGGVIVAPVGHLIDTTDDRADLGQLTLDRLDALFLDHALLIGEDLRQVLGQEIEVVKNHLERVVDPVRQANGKLAQRGQLIAAADIPQVLEKADRANFCAGLIVDERA